MYEKKITEVIIHINALLNSWVTFLDNERLLVPEEHIFQIIMNVPTFNRKFFPLDFA